MNLCKKCRDFLDNHSYKSQFIEPPWTHCHHDESENKPKCWCEISENREFYYTRKPHSLMWSTWSATPDSVNFIPKFCPFCGRKLLEDK